MEDFDWRSLFVKIVSLRPLLLINDLLALHSNSFRLKMEKSTSQFRKNSTSGFTPQRRGPTSRRSCSIPAKSFCQKKPATRLSWATRRSRTTLSRRWRFSRPTGPSTSSWCKRLKRRRWPKASTRREPAAPCHSQKMPLFLYFVSAAVSSWVLVAFEVIHSVLNKNLGNLVRLSSSLFVICLWRWILDPNRSCHWMITWT